MLIRLLCAHEITKHVSKISRLNSKRLLRKRQKMLGGYFILPHPVDQGWTTHAGVCHSQVQCIVHKVSPWWRPFTVTLRVSKLTLTRAHYCFVFVLQDQAKIQAWRNPHCVKLPPSPKRKPNHCQTCHEIVTPLLLKRSQSAPWESVYFTRGIITACN